MPHVLIAADADWVVDEVRSALEGPDVTIDVIDNGIDLPKENRNRLLEPYVTTREKGTGLGLAIVGRILEDHGGGIELRDASEKFPGERGAWMRLKFKAEIEDAAPSIDTAKASSDASHLDKAKVTSER